MISSRQEIVYTCADGEKFYTKEDAVNHEVRLQITTLLQGSLYQYENTLDSVVDFVLKNLDEINKIVGYEY
ncbi:MAG: hypothetical protein E6053_07400 [Finegoldia magna]|uniref:hypothetical protein n=1 Tax=Finegoldia TaxID=150022 RepID=UPI002901F45B|nr:hypothetical protein [Finegoldia magna]MDU2574761.1 hypothetical protein [Finegoldia magna]MDU5527276.1 hypothetical protein [Finegoldia magna]